MAVKLLAAVCSDKGCVRQNNEDNFCLNGLYLKREEMDAGGLFKCQANEQAVFAVCDGMGGEEAGEEASLLSVSRIAAAHEAHAELFDAAELRNFLHQGCQAVFERARMLGNRAGATVALLTACPQGMRVANMGDSRIYRLHEGRMKQISADHTEIQRLLEQGRITPDQIKTHPKRHMINQYWGMPLDRAPFTPHISSVIPYVHQDRFLLCSDGLTDMLSDQEIETILSQKNTVEHICQELVRHAKQKGGRDNVTVCVVEVVNKSSGTMKTAKKDLGKLYSRRKLWAFALAALLAADLYLILEWVDWLRLH